MKISQAENFSWFTKVSDHRSSTTLRILETRVADVERRCLHDSCEAHISEGFYLSVGEIAFAISRAHLFSNRYVLYFSATSRFINALQGRVGSGRGRRVLTFSRGFDRRFVARGPRTLPIPIRDGESVSVTRLLTCRLSIATRNVRVSQTIVDK